MNLDKTEWEKGGDTHPICLIQLIRIGFCWNVWYVEAIFFIYFQ